MYLLEIVSLKLQIVIIAEKVSQSIIEDHQTSRHSNHRFFALREATTLPLLTTPIITLDILVEIIHTNQQSSKISILITLTTIILTIEDMIAQIK